MSNVAIVLGAGNGTRMKTKDSKLLLKIGNKTVIQRSVDTFLNYADIDEVIVTVRQQDLETFSNLMPNERISFVVGGNSRQESVKNAIDTIDDANIIVIHDGARPLISEDSITKTFRKAQECGCAAVGVKVKDTIKQVDSKLNIVSTPNRDELVAIQTPQIFDFKLYKKALDKATNDNKNFTDDCQLLEYIGKTVKVVLGDYNNIKITTPEDIAVAESIIDSQGE